MNCALLAGIGFSATLCVTGWFIYYVVMKFIAVTSHDEKITELKNDCWEQYKRISAVEDAIQRLKIGNKKR
jgi:hypothetical protein